MKASDFKVEGPKKEKELSIAEQCVKEVNDSLKRHNCRFDVETILRESGISYNVLIREIAVIPQMPIPPTETVQWVQNQEEVSHHHVLLVREGST